jgi:hypothetical protein
MVVQPVLPRQRQRGRPPLPLGCTRRRRRHVLLFFCGLVLRAPCTPPSPCAVRRRGAPAGRAWTSHARQRRRRTPPRGHRRCAPSQSTRRPAAPPPRDGRRARPPWRLLRGRAVGQRRQLLQVYPAPSPAPVRGGTPSQRRRRQLRLQWARRLRGAHGPRTVARTPAERRTSMERWVSVRARARCARLSMCRVGPSARRPSRCLS